DLDADVGVTVPNGVQISGVDLSSATFDLTFDNPTDNIFDGLIPQVSLKSDGGDDLLDFSNLGPNEVLGMLEQLVNTLTAMAENEAMQVAIPFTDFTVGDLLDYATAFKSSVIDPLFESGNLLQPDNDGDGQPDLKFESIQDLMTILGGFVSVATAQFNPTNRELRINLDFNRALGFGSAKVGTSQEGGGGENEIQTVEVNAIDSDGTLADTFKLGFTDSSGVVELTEDIDFDADAATVETRLEALSAIDDVMVTRDGNVYEITFLGNLTDTNVAAMISDSTQLKGEFPMDFGVELGDLAGITTSADFSMEAALDLELTFGIDLSPSTSIELTGPVFNPQNVADVLISQPDGSAENDFSTQIIRIDNATLGTFKLDFNGSQSGDLAYNISAGALETAIEGLAGITDVSIAPPDIELGDRVFTVTFNNPASPSVLLTADASNLKGAADGILSNTANFNFNLINQAITVEKSTGNPDIGSGITTLIDNDATFISDGVEVGDIIINSKDGSTAVVTVINSETQITHSALTGGISNSWQITDDYQIS
ncbi:hypothetical protein MJD09_20805, partial [bacterium]|nr:hypothetical protein [bacterium]